MKERARNMSMDGSENTGVLLISRYIMLPYQGMYKPSLTNMTNNPLLNRFCVGAVYKGLERGEV